MRRLLSLYVFFNSGVLSNLILKREVVLFRAFIALYSKIDQLAIEEVKSAVATNACSVSDGDSATEVK